MLEAISDTGPILHLQEINRLHSLSVFARLVIPGLVADELHAYGLRPADLAIPGVEIATVSVDAARRERILAQPFRPPIHPADAEVFVLAQDHGFQTVVLTDDLALRRRLEMRGATAVGTVGILVRAYKVGKLTHTELEHAVDILFTESTLHLSRAFRSYVRQLLVGVRDAVNNNPPT